MIVSEVITHIVGIGRHKLFFTFLFEIKPAVFIASNFQFRDTWNIFLKTMLQYLYFS